jgi:hypothetical protein
VTEDDDLLEVSAISPANDRLASVCSWVALIASVAAGGWAIIHVL